MKSIGGYFGLELSRGSSFHRDLISLNSGRNCLELVLRNSEFDHVLVPLYSCNFILEPIIKLGIKFSFFSINERFEPIIDFSKYNSRTAIILINYFGLYEEFIRRFVNNCPLNVIVDNTQAFFSKPLSGVTTLYSPRKFFGVPDGGYLHFPFRDVLTDQLEKASSLDRVSHLIGRIDKDAETYYSEFVLNDSSLSGLPIQKMSNLTSTILNSIDYDFVVKTRIVNFNFLWSALSDKNLFTLPRLTNSAVPMVFPFWTGNVNLRYKLREKRVYCPVFWPCVLDLASEKSFEKRVCDEFVFLPIDQRYNITDMDFIVTEIMKELN